MCVSVNVEEEPGIYLYADLSRYLSDGKVSRNYVGCCVVFIGGILRVDSPTCGILVKSLQLSYQESYLSV